MGTMFSLEYSTNPMLLQDVTSEADSLERRGSDILPPVPRDHFFLRHSRQIGFNFDYPTASVDRASHHGL